MTRNDISSFNYNNGNQDAITGSIGNYAIFGGGISSDYVFWVKSINTSLTVSSLSDQIYGTLKASASTSSYLFFYRWGRFKLLSTRPIHLQYFNHKSIN